MPWPVYSEEILRVTGSAGWFYATVPAGHVAVVKSVTMKGDSGSTQGAQLSIGGVVIAWLAIPAATYGLAQSMHQVAYEGQQIGISLSAAMVGCGVGGYVFTDPGTAYAWTGELEAGPAPENAADWATWLET